MHSNVQHQQLDGPVRQYDEGAAAVGGGGGGSDKDLSNGVGTGDDVQGCGLEHATLWEREFGSERYDTEGAGGFHHQMARKIAGM